MNSSGQKRMDSHSSSSGDCHVDLGIAFITKESSAQFLRVEIVSTSPETQFAKKDSGDGDGPVVLRVKTFHASSAIAARSKFISKLLSNNKALDEGNISIQIKDSEEAAFTELLNFIYNDTSSSTTAPELLNILKLAEKFEIDSCVRYCIERLSDLPMTTELALLYLEALPHISFPEEVQPLIESAKLFLRYLYKDIISCQDELMSFPLSGIEAILSADDLDVSSEDDVFDFVMKWANVHYPNLEERREILSSRLIKYIRFPYMSSSRLVEVPKSPELDKKVAFVSVHNALVSKLDALFVKASYLQNISPIRMDDSLRLSEKP